MPPFRQYEVVRVRRLLNTAENYDGWKVNTRPPGIGDVGTLVEILHAPGLPDRYVVECVRIGGDGTTDWLGDFAEDELERAD